MLLSVGGARTVSSTIIGSSVDHAGPPDPVQRGAGADVSGNRLGGLVASANFSYSAAYRNIEFGIKLDNPALAESVERELRNVEGVLYEQVYGALNTW